MYDNCTLGVVTLSREIPLKKDYAVLQDNVLVVIVT